MENASEEAVGKSGGQTERRRDGSESGRVSQKVGRVRRGSWCGDVDGYCTGGSAGVEWAREQNAGAEAGRLEQK